ncbi:MAG: VanW family protein [Oscillospiraceae bacterium]|nr:VanW family protein [Oscillospiraceae bacterium]
MDTKTERETTAVPKRARRKKQAKHSGVKRAIAVVVCAFAAAFAASVAALLVAVPEDVVASGVYADNIELSGMSMEEAAAAIAEHDFFETDRISVSAEGNTYEIPTESIELAVDAAQTAKKAFEIGKSGNKLSDAKDVLIMRFSDKQAGIVPSVNTEALNAQLYEFGKQLYGELTEHSVEVGENTVTVTPGKTGASSDYTDAIGQIMDAVSGGKYSDIQITMNKQSPAEVDVDRLYEEIYAEPQDAGFETSAKSASVKSHVVGVELDKDDAHDKVSKIKEGGEPVEIKIIRTMPQITKEMLENKLFNKTLASFSTKYSASNVNRSQNLALAASKMNGTVLAPGEVFSYNDVVGKRTAANGFKNAPVYENGKSVDGIGGGVCQVSTTLYSAVLYADLKIVSRRNHSLPVAYVPLGQDATVVDDAIDFQFENNTNYPIKIVSSAAKGTIDVSIVGTEREKERTVKLEHKTLSRTDPTTKEIKNPDLPAGTTKTVSKGKAGYVVESTKIVYENGAEVSRESLGKSTYKMVPTEVEVGTGQAAPQNSSASQSAPQNAPQSVPQPAQTAESQTGTNVSETAQAIREKQQNSESALAAAVQEMN